MPRPVSDPAIAEVARDLVAQLAPQELPVFRANSQAYFTDPERALKSRAPKDDMLGFGAGEAVTFMTPVVLAVVTDVFGFLAAEIKKSIASEGAAAASDLIRRVFKKFRGREPEAADTAPPLRAEQIAQVRRLAFEKARQLKLSEPQAGLLADSLVGSLVSAG